MPSTLSGRQKMIQKHKDFNIFQYIQEHGNGEEFQPEGRPVPTNAPPGSGLKINVLMQRLEAGEDLWNDLDRDDFDNLIAPIKPYRD